MLKINELKSGDVIMVNDDGVMREGRVVSTSLEENQALVNNGVQDFWYSPEDMTPVSLSEEHLMRFGFTKEELDGGVKYKKDSFRLLTPKKGDFSNVEMWWREDRRHFGMPIGVHHFQNLFMDMTKIHLDMP
ncbi:MAG: hypothetical protein E6H07_16400 [Bacteroidetes bacterium]|nr:MAG: hypothetical protein E6H07_16400 [Bacteroidota bacterium]